MAAISETCSVCGSEFDVQFRYQMEERDGGFSFYCTQRCLEKSQVAGADQGGASATCDACAKRFQPDLVSQVLYRGGRRRYACSLGCRTQLLREASGVRLGEIAATAVAAPETVAGPEAAAGLEAVVGPVAVAGPVNGALGAADEAQASSKGRRGDGPRSAEAPQSAARPGGSGAAAGPAARVAGVSAANAVSGAAGHRSAGEVAPGAPQSAPAAAAPVSQGRRSAAATSGAATAVAVHDAGPAGRAIAPKMAAAGASGGVPRCLAVFNHKGGTGKTTTAVSVAAGLAARGKRVLLVDTDAQGNVSVSLGANSERSLYHVLVMGLRVADATRTVRPNLDLLPSNETLAAAELYLAGRQNRDRVLCDRLLPAAAGYDFVVLDCSPSLSLMNQNALVFADSVLVPVACDYLSLVGVRQVIKTVKNVNALLHHPVQIWGVLPTFFDARAKIAREAVSTLKSHFGDRCLTPIRAAIKVKEAPAQGQTIFEYAAGTPAAEDYAIVVERILQSRQLGPRAETGAETASHSAAAGA